jgi:hypothetical protein
MATAAARLARKPTLDEFFDRHRPARDKGALRHLGHELRERALGLPLGPADGPRGVPLPALVVEANVNQQLPRTVAALAHVASRCPCSLPTAIGGIACLD